MRDAPYPHPLPSKERGASEVSPFCATGWDLPALVLAPRLQAAQKATCAQGPGLPRLVPWQLGTLHGLWRVGRSGLC